MNYMEKFPVRLNVRMEEDLRDEAQKIAMKMGVSTSALFRIAMKQMINRKQNL
jgi:antitoxin component of RelBE/YafQ-DinJ toxin-antitoxin module